LKPIYTYIWDKTQRLGSATTNGAIVTVKQRLLNSTWLGSIEKLQETPPPLPLYPPQIQNILHQDSTVRST